MTASAHDGRWPRAYRLLCFIYQQSLSFMNGIEDASGTAGRRVRQRSQRDGKVVRLCLVVPEDWASPDVVIFAFLDS